jgi:hypothetical protein
MKRARSSLRETTLIIFVAAAALTLLILFVPGRGRVTAPCEILPARKWELRLSEQGWQSRLTDYRRGGLLFIETHDVGGPARVSLAAATTTTTTTTAAGGSDQGPLAVESGRVVARMVPSGAALDRLGPTGAVNFGLAQDIATPIAGRLILGGGSLCAVETTDTLVARVLVPQDVPLTVEPGATVWLEVPGHPGRSHGTVLPVPPGPGTQPGEWQIWVEIPQPAGLEAGMWGMARATRTETGFLSVLWSRLREGLEPRIQFPTQ